MTCAIAVSAVLIARLRFLPQIMISIRLQNDCACICLPNKQQCVCAGKLIHFGRVLMFQLLLPW